MKDKGFCCLMMSAGLLALAVPAFAQRRAADGVAINDQGLPQYSTFSLCGRRSSG